MTDPHGLTMTELLHRMRSINYWSLISGMTPAEVTLLAAICDENGENRKISDLCNICGMQPTAVSRLMNSLEEKELIIRNTRKGNRRITDVEPTEAGQNINARNQAILHDYWNQVLANVPQEDVNTMLHVMNEIMDSMEQILAAKTNNKEMETH